MEFFFIPLVAFAASLLTFFSGFGLGTLLTPIFAVFFPIELAVVLTAIVHFLNGLFKLGLVGKFADKKIIIAFGIPAILASLLGAWTLIHLAYLSPLFSYSLAGRTLQVLPVKLILSLVMLAFTLFEIIPVLKNLEFNRKFIPVGGFISGFFGGLSGHQGALRSAFLARAGLNKQQFIGTGVTIAVLIDLARLSVYSKHLTSVGVTSNLKLLAITTLLAFLGAYLGNKLLKKMTMKHIQHVVSVSLILLALAIGAGFI